MVKITLRPSGAAEWAEGRVNERDRLDSGWWGAYNEAPDRIISILEVKLGNEYLPLSRSAFCDLSEVHSAEIKTFSNDFVLTIYGGDTGTGYFAELKFKTGYLVERQVTHNEMGLQEKTTYFPVHDN